MKQILIALTLLVSTSVHANLDYYFGASKDYNAATLKPAEVLGFEVGEWHARPEQLTEYYRKLAATSDRIELLEIGKSHEQRPLTLLFISSPENLQNLESLRQSHLAGEPDAPLVTWLGYAIHGNEPSAANVVPLLAYHFAASQASGVQETLDDQIIIIDPMLNPDGVARFAHWVNMYKSQSQNPDPRNMEFNEAWPRGRTNHYWFDLNRDWLPVQHPESVARVTQFQRWRPHVLTDHHEMGKDRTFFFQPGVVTRQNPLTDPENFRVTGLIAEFHAKALDKLGTLYYTKEGFDDFYYGKGSTYPDAQGTIGILFEQASVRGHTQQTIYGVRTFPEAIRNQLAVSLSTVEAVQNRQTEIRNVRVSSAATAKELIEADQYAGAILSTGDEYRMNEMLRILQLHQIEHSFTQERFSSSGKTYPAGSLVVPYDQAQYRLAKSMFESRKDFVEDVFYDVSTWNMGFAMDFTMQEISQRQLRSLTLGEMDKSAARIDLTRAIAVAIDWKNMGSAKALSLLLQQGITTVAVTKPTALVTDEGAKQLSLGSIIVPLEADATERKNTLQKVVSIAGQAKVELIPIESGLASAGVDMGSPSIIPVPRVRPLLIIGDGVRSYDAGEVWHFLDERLGQPVTMVNQSQFKRTDLSSYTHILMADGSYNFSKKDKANIERWVRSGGNIIASSRAAKWLVEQTWMSSEPKKFDPAPDLSAKYGNKSQIDALNVVGGSIAAATIDVTHPLGFGMDDVDLSWYKRGTLAFTEPREAFVAVARFQDKALRAGYMSEAVEAHLGGSPALLVQRLGQGRLIAFSDNPLFRGYWLGTMRLYANALYFAPLINTSTATVKPAKTP
jgi:hypothetical protein